MKRFGLEGGLRQKSPGGLFIGQLEREGAVRSEARALETRSLEVRERGRLAGKDESGAFEQRPRQRIDGRGGGLFAQRDGDPEDAVRLPRVLAPRIQMNAGDHRRARPVQQEVGLAECGIEGGVVRRALRIRVPGNEPQVREVSYEHLPDAAV